MTKTTATTTKCVACGLPSVEEFCLRPECLTHGSGACAPAPGRRF
jgi:hypothetical protein